jgi:hypothetical protein
MYRKELKIRGKSTYFNQDWQDAELNPDFSEWVEKVKARTNITSVGGVTKNCN